MEPGENFPGKSHEQTKISDVLGYDHPDKDLYRKLAERSGIFLDHPYGFMSPGYTYVTMSSESLRAYPGLEAALEKIKGDIKGGVMADIGCGDSPDGMVALKFEVSKLIGIDIALASDELKGIETSIETRSYADGHEVMRMGDDVLCALAKIKPETLDLVYSRAFDIFQGDKRLLFKEIHRVLKPGGYTIFDGQTGYYFDRSYNKDEFDVIFSDTVFILKKK